MTSPLTVSERPAVRRHSRLPQLAGRSGADQTALTSQAAAGQAEHLGGRNHLGRPGVAAACFDTLAPLRRFNLRLIATSEGR